MVEAGETEIARDELVWLLSECPDFLEAHVQLGLIALEEDDAKLARGHFGRAYELAFRALDAAGGPRPLPYELAGNKPFFEAAKGLVHSLMARAAGRWPRTSASGSPRSTPPTRSASSDAQPVRPARSGPVSAAASCRGSRTRPGAGAVSGDEPPLGERFMRRDALLHSPPLVPRSPRAGFGRPAAAGRRHAARRRRNDPPLAGAARRARHRRPRRARRRLVAGAEEAAPTAALVICPGGGYGGLADHEGSDYARWLNAQGISAFVLRYRLGSKGYRHPVMLGDVSRAIRLVRPDHERRNRPARVGVMGVRPAATSPSPPASTAPRAIRGRRPDRPGVVATRPRHALLSGREHAPGENPRRLAEEPPRQAPTRRSSGSSPASSPPTTRCRRCSSGTPSKTRR